MTRKKLCLSLHYNGGSSYLFVNGEEIIKFKAKDSDTKITALNGYIYDFSVDYDAIGVADILDIHKYLIKKNEIL